MKRDYNVIEAIIINKTDNIIEFVNCNYRTLYEKFLDDSCTYYIQYEYDESGNKASGKDSTRVECLIEYNNDNTIRHYKSTDGYEYWNTHNENGKLIYSKVIDVSVVHEYWYEYNEQGHEIHFKDSTGYEEWFDYDKKGNITHSKTSRGIEIWKEYDGSDNLIHRYDNNGNNWWYTEVEKENN